MSTMICPICDEEAENPKGECPEQFACEACRENLKAEQALWDATDWSELGG